MAVTRRDIPRPGLLSTRHQARAVEVESGCQPTQAAIDLFNEVTEKLEESYGELERKIDNLNSELSDVEAQRNDELNKKNKLAKQLEQILNVLPGGVVVIDGKGVITKVNPAAAGLLAKNQADLIGANWSSVINQSFNPKEDDGHEISLHNGRRVSISITPLGNEPGQIIQLIDQTETRLLQDRLAHHQRLSDMGRMVASLAHQIRTPLSAAMLYCSHLAKPQLNESSRLKFAKRVQQRLQHLEQQVKDMLLFAKGKVPLNDRICAEQILEDTKVMVEGLTDRAAFSFSVHPLAKQQYILGNRDALLGAIVNLINNSIEASASGNCSVEIDIYRHDNLLSIQVSDHGSGLEDSDAERLLEPFYTTKSHGTGLGLSVVKSIALAHYGAFEISNRADDKGAISRIQIPILNQTDLFEKGGACE